MSVLVERMRAATPRLQSFAAALAHTEIVLLALIYAYFVISDSVPPLAWVLIALFWAVRWWMRGALTLPTPFDVPIVLILLLLPLSLSVSTNWYASLPKVYGIILGVAFFYAVVNNVANRTDLAWASFWVVLVCAAMALAGLVGTDWAQGKIISASFIYDRLPRIVQGIPRSIAGGFARNGVGGTLTLIVPFLAAVWWGALGGVGREKTSECHCEPADLAGEAIPNVDSGKSMLGIAAQTPPAMTSERVRNDNQGRLFKSVVALAFLVSALTLALTQSRGAILGTGVGLLVIAIWRERRLKWLVVAGAAGLLVLLLIGQGSTVAEFVLRMDSRNGTLASRMEVWQRGVLMVQDFPFTGIGIGNYNAVAHSLYPFFIAAPDEVVAHAHNNFLEVAVDLGIPGLVAYTALLTGFVCCLVRAYGSAADEAGRALAMGVGSGMLAHQVFGLTDAFILGTKPGVLMWVFFGLAVVVYRMGRGEEP